MYCPSDRNSKPDALSEHCDHRLEGGSEASQPVLRLFKPDQLWLAAFKVVWLMPTSQEHLLGAAAEDPEYQRLKNVIFGGKIGNALQWSLQDNVIHWKNR